MGWKSTIDLSRSEAEAVFLSADLDKISNSDLATIVELIRGGDDHGHNYRVFFDGQMYIDNE